jgi:nucleoside-triphosphatase
MDAVSGQGGAIRILLEGRPGVGKTTVARRLVDELRGAGVPISGFTTEEMRHDGGRVGFAIETVAGERDVLAHVDLPGPPRVGRYGVDVAVLERLAIPALDPGPDGGAAAGPTAVVVVDELGKMELASGRFCEAVAALFGKPVDVVATVMVAPHPFTDELKRHPRIEVVHVMAATREDLPARLARRLVRLRPGRT